MSRQLLAPIRGPPSADYPRAALPIPFILWQDIQMAFEKKTLSYISASELFTGLDLAWDAFKEGNHEHQFEELTHALVTLPDIEGVMEPLLGDEPDDDDETEAEVRQLVERLEGVLRSALIDLAS